MATKVTNLQETKVLNDSDKIYVVYDVDGTPLSRGMTKKDFKDSLALSTNGVNRVVSGGMRWVSGLIYESVDLVYEVNGEQFSIFNGTQVTLDAAPTTATFERLDIIYGDDTGALGVSKGTASATPATPTLESYQLQLNIVLLTTSATEPDGVSIRTVYTENAGQTGEFDATENTSAARIDLADTSDPITGTYSIKTTSNLNNEDSITLTHATATTFANLASIQFDIKLLSDWGNDYISMNLIKDSTTVRSVLLNSNIINTSNNSTVQNINIFKSDLGVVTSGVDFNKIEILARVKGASALSFILDNIYINEDSNVVQPVNLTGLDIELDTTNFDTNLDNTITDVQKLADAVDDLALGSGSGVLEYQTEITASTTLDGTQKGLSKVYPVNNTAARTITITTGDYVLNDVINIERRGQGSVEIIADTGVRIRGTRDINNRYFINDVNSIVAVLCRGSEEFAIIGNLTRGYTGAVTTTSYSTLVDGAGAQNITVIGTGFSANMLDPVLTGNATLNSWAYVNPSQITLNITETGAINDTITVDYDNGDLTTDTDAITIVVAPPNYDTNDLRHYYPLSTDSNDADTPAINGTDTSMTYPSGAAVFDGSASYIDFVDDDSFSFGDGSTDNDLSISFTASFDDVTPAGTMKIINKWSATPREYQIQVTAAGLLYATFRDESSTGSISKYIDISGYSTATDYHFVITKSGTTVAIYVDGVSQALTDANAGSYTAMENTTTTFRIGAIGGTASQFFDGTLKRVGLWGVVLSATGAADVYTEEVTNNNDLL